MTFMARSAWMTLVVGSTAAGLLASPQAASAEGLRRTDPRRDVVAVEIDAGPNHEHVATVNERRKHGDIVSMRVRHRDRRVVVRLLFRRVADKREIGTEIGIRTEDARYVVNVSSIGEHDIHVFILNLTENLSIQCANLGTRMSTERSVFRASIPRRCLDRPRWVRVGASTRTRARSADLHYDDALHRGRDDSDFHFGPTLGPRLRRG
jgi:hypothetical protein